MTTQSNDHAIPLDEMLADAATHLRDDGMLALSEAVEIARARLSGADEGASSTRLKCIEESAPNLDQLCLASVQ
jgi:hypothetical protein